MTRLTADAGQWSRVVADIKSRFRDRAPELLAEVQFAHRPPLPPYSEQLDDFFRDAGVSGILAAGHPRYKTFPFPESMKDQIRKERSPLLAPYLALIQEMSGQLLELAAPPEPER